MPVADVGLDGYDHPLLQLHIPPLHQKRLLLVPPGADAVAHEGRRVVGKPVLQQRLPGKEVDVADPGPDPALFDGLQIYVPVLPVHLPLLIRGLSQAGHTGLVARVSFEKRHVVGADDVPLADGEIALAHVHGGVPARGEDPMHEMAAPLEAALDEPAVDLPLRVAVSNGGKHLQMGLVLEVRRPLQQGYLTGGS